MKMIRFCLLVLLLLLITACRQKTTPYPIDTGVPMMNSEPEENHFDPNYRPHDDEGDNMRGIDPAWEDDMEDNGLTRYQENYDDEGWD